MQMRIKELLARRGVKQYEAAVDMGISAASLSRIASGDQNTKIKTLQRIADYLDVTVPDLFVYEGRNAAVRWAWGLDEDRSRLAAELLETFERHTRSL